MNQYVMKTAAAVALVAGLAGCGGGGSGPVVPTPTPTPIGTPLPVSLSSLPGRLVIARQADGVSKMFIVRPDGTARRDLGAGTQPALAPDGKTLAFTSLRGVELLDLTNSARRVLVAGGRAPAWSFDGTRVAFEKPLNPRGAPPNFISGISIINPDGSDEKALTTGSFTPGPLDASGSRSTLDLQPTWHPSGKYLTFVRISSVNNTDTRKFVNVDLGGKELAPPLPNRENQGFLANADWNPDGQRFAFAKGQAIFVAQGGNLTRQSATNSDATTLPTPHWSPAGRYLATATSLGIEIYDGNEQIGTVPDTEKSYTFAWSRLP